MARLNQGRTIYLVEARQGLIGAASVGIVSLALGGLGALPLPVVAMLVFLSGIFGFFAARRARRRQAEMALVLRDSSASESARKATEMIRRLLADGKSFESVVSTMHTLTARRRHPHTAMLAKVYGILGDAIRETETDASWRQRAIAACDEALRHQIISRNQTVEALASVLDEVAPTVDVVLLYGYSSVVCAGVIASSKIRQQAIWIVQDLQYGRDSVDEHKQVRDILAGHGARVEVIAYEDVYTVFGHASDPFVRNIELRVLPLMNQRRILAIIGCEAFDTHGAVLIPARADGEPSETARFVELASTSNMDGVEPRLLVVGESVKQVPSVQALDKRTQVPLPTSWWRKPMHYLGIVIPFSGRDVQLVEVSVGAHNVVSDGGLIGVPPTPALPSDEPTPEASELGSLELDAYSAIVIDLDSALTDSRIVAYERLAALVAARSPTSLQFSTFQAVCSGLSDPSAIQALVELGLLKDDVLDHVEWLAHHPELSSPASPIFVNGAHAFMARLRSRTNRVGVITSRSSMTTSNLLEETFLGEILATADLMTSVDLTRAYRQFANLSWVGIDHTLPALFISREENVVALALAAGHQGLLLGQPESTDGDLRLLSAAMIEGHSDPLDQLQMSRSTDDPLELSMVYKVVASADLDPDSERQYLRLCRAGFPERSWDIAALRRRALSPNLVTVLTIRDPDRPSLCLGIATLHEGTVSGEAKLHWVVVSPTSRRTGVGRALTAFAVNAAAQQGYSRISLTTERSRVGAVVMYEGCGFVRDWA